MKKLTLLIGMLVLLITSTFSKPVNPKTAIEVGTSFLTSLDKMQARRSSVNLRLVYTSNSLANSMIATANVTNYYYVFNNDDNGFVIVSGDDIVIPVLAYSNESAFDPNNIPPSVQKWLEGYKSQIREAIEKKMQATAEITAEWNNYLNGTQSNLPAAPTATVNPLIQTKWNQSPHFNALCPYDNQNAERTVTGCVATAMAQIMKFWNQPVNGTGFHSYNHSKYGTLSANFGSTTYNWASMPNVVNSANSAVATLMYHCGISVDMNYDIAANGGSGAYVTTSESPVTHCSEYALKTYFGYKSSLKGVSRKNYSEAQWISLLKADLDAGKPILYAGFGSGGGHCFVCDGYDNNNYFHFNWGWGGAYDGYFTVNALNPAGVGTGGGSGGFNSGQHAVTNIEPTNTGGGGGGNTTQDLRLYSSLSMSNTSVWFTSAFDLSVDIANFGDNPFNGELSAAVFDEDYNFIDFMEKKSTSINNGYYSSYTFNNAGSPKYVPGKYYVAVFYKTPNSDWTIVKDGSYTNLLSFNVKYSTDIEVNSTFKISGNKIVQNSTANINVDVLNSGSSTFWGSFRLDLAKLDGSLAQTIQVLNETKGLNANYHYTNGLDFSGKITVAPGTYLLSVAFQVDGSNKWYYAGSSNYKNPIYVIVEEAPPSPDKYENNDTKVNAYNLTLSFSNGTANILTTGSNIHIGTDNDYYKFNLPSGKEYTVRGRVHDLNNSGNGNSYTVDVLFSMSKDGTFWSDAYDDIMNEGIPVDGGSTFYFRIAPYFTGKTGTYLLDITINEGNNANITPLDADNYIKVYPNPAQDFINIEPNRLHEQILSVQILNVMGQTLLTQEITQNDNIITLPVTHLSNGIFYVQCKTNNGIITKKIIINK